MRVRLAIGAAFLIMLAGSLPAYGQLPAEQVADLLLGAARKAYNERNYPFAADRFREFLQKFGGHANAPAARYGLALTLIDMPERKYSEAAEQLQAIGNDKGSANYALAQYHLGLCRRALGLGEIAQIAAKPNEAPQRRQAANQRFAEAERNFAEAAAAFWARVKPDPLAKELPLDIEWYARARCDHAEMLLRLAKPKESRETTQGFIQDPVLAKSRYLRLGHYYHGYSCYLLRDFQGAVKAINRKEIFDDATFGGHARYLMARIHHADGEAAEAAAQYDAVTADYQKQKALAIESLKRPEQFRDNPEERARLDALIKSPPDYVLSATLDSAMLLYDAGKFGEALSRFQDFAKQNPNAARVAEAHLHTGYCQVQTKQFTEAVNTLTPLAAKYPQIADQSLLWLGKAQAQVFDANNPQSRIAALTAAINTLKQAANHANQLANTDAGAKVRRAEIMLELADTMQTATQYRESAGIYEQLLNEKMLPTRAEEVTQRLATALHLAGDYVRSDQVCAKFMTDFPQGPLRGAVSFRSAENAYFVAVVASKRADFPNRAQELPKLFDEAGKRFQFVVDKFPEFERVQLVRYSLAMCHIQKSDYEKARTVLETIPIPDRVGDLTLTPYLLADCLLRLMPTDAEDAAAAGKLLEMLQVATALLDGFVGANAQLAEAPDAMLKLGYCQQRLGQLLAQPPEKAAAIQAARATYDKFTQQYAKDARVPQAAFERAKVKLLANDVGGAQNDLRQFLAGTYQEAAIAPLAVIRLASLLRQQNQPAEAAKALDDCRKRHEPALANDKGRAGWTALLRYHHGVALMESGKLSDARGLFDQVAQPTVEKTVAAEAALRGGQCRMLEGRQRIETATQKVAAAKPEAKAAAQKELDDAWNTVRDAAKYLEQQAEAFKAVAPNAEPRARMFYDAAWAYRQIADAEVAAIRERMTQDEHKKRQDEAVKKAPPGTKIPPVPVPEIARSLIPLQPAEDKARNAYRALISSFADAPLANEARFELAEVLAQRDEFDPAIALLRETIDKEPPQELTDRTRLRLGACLLAKKDAKNAIVQFELVSDPKSPSFAQAVYRAGEAYIDLGVLDKAIAKLILFRDKQEFQNESGLTDRALLRLGVAYSLGKQWDAARQANDVLAQRFAGSPWIHEARYNIGWARQNLQQYEEAVAAYQQVVNATTTELAAKAQLQIGLCRLEQKRFAEAAAALLIVPNTFDFPELSAAALCEASRCYVELKNREQAERLLLRVVRDHAASDWAKVAQERLELLRKNTGT